MRISQAIILGGAAALFAAGTAAVAAEALHTVDVALPDGSIAQIAYAGDVAPEVTVVPSEARTVIAYDPFAGFDRIMAAMEARHQAMMMQMAALQKAATEAAASGEPGLFTVIGDLPEGVHYTMVSSTTDANGCTQTVRYTSDGSEAAPTVTRVSAGQCDAARPEARQPIEANASVPAAPAPVGREV